MGDAKLKSFVDRIERVEGERKDLAGDVRDIYVEAKGNGYNPKALRKIIAQRRQKTDEQLEAEIEAYRAALGMPGATYRSVAEEFGVKKSTLHRLVPNSSRGTRPMVDGDIGEWQPDHDAETGELQREMVADDLGDPLLLVDKPRAEFKARVRAIAASVKVAPSPVGPVLADAPPAELPNLPAFLDRRVSA
jgi:uncharacterized protein (UPF0335 family)